MTDSERELLEILKTFIPGLDVEKYFHAWRLAHLLWLSTWKCSAIDWSRYRTTMWSRFMRWLASAARRSRDVAGLAGVYSRDARLEQIGSNSSERDAFLALLALPAAEQKQIVQQLRANATVVVALVRKFQDLKSSERELENEETTDLLD